MGKIQQEYQERVRHLHPHMKEAEEADREFHQEWDAGVEAQGVQKYKQSSRYKSTLARFSSVTRNLQEMVDSSIRKAQDGDSKSSVFLLAYMGYPGRFFRSGYTKARIARALKRVSLDEGLKSLLRDILLGSFSWAGGEFKVFREWIPRLRTPEFMDRIKTLSQAEDAKTRRRAEQVIQRFL